jgi:hypothetical protein
MGQMVVTQTAWRFRPAICSNGGPDFAVLWTDDGGALSGRIVRPDGLGDTFAVATGAQIPAATIAGNITEPGFAVAWLAGQDVMVGFFRHDGAPMASAQKANSSPVDIEHPHA